MPSYDNPVIPLRKLWAVRIFGVATGLLLCLSLFFCLVRANANGYYYLAALNIVLSSFIGGLMTMWYRSGYLPEEKLWYMFLVGSVLIVQSAVTDVYVFHHVKGPKDTGNSTMG